MTVVSRNPFTGEVLQTFPSASVSEVNGAVSRARSAQESWSRLSLAERQKFFGRLKTVVEQQMDGLLELIKRETGKVTADGEAEVYDILDGIEYYTREAEKWNDAVAFQLNEEALPSSDGRIEYVPFGVIGLIMPWNFPFYSPAMFAIAALMAGNAVVLKPSEYSSMVGLRIRELFEEAGFPMDLVTIVLGADDTGAALAKSAVDKIFFVGSIETGRKVIEASAGKPVQVELGGNSAALVLSDADIELAAQGIAWGATYYSGQDCVAVKRILVEDQVADEFISRLVAIVSDLRPGVDYGPYISAEARDEVDARIKAAVADGAKLLTGGERVEPGFWLTPSVLELKDLKSMLVATETFGNAAPVIRVGSADEAVELANATHYGLSNAVFSRDLERAEGLARRLEAGMTFINDPLVPFPGWDHWTGWKGSGFGTIESKYAQCLKKRVIATNKGGDPRSFWYPY